MTWDSFVEIHSSAVGFAIFPAGWETWPSEIVLILRAKQMEIQFENNDVHYWVLAHVGIPSPRRDILLSGYKVKSCPPIQHLLCVGWT